MLLGLLYTVVILPAAYSVAAYYGVRAGLWPGAAENKAPTVSLLVWLLLSIPSISKWWDVWVRPGPKMSVPWETPTPGEFIVRSVTGNGIALVVLVGASQLLSPTLVPVWLLMFILVVTIVAFSTPRGSGYDSGQVIR